MTQNDIVVLASEHGTWQVIAPVNGSKADIRRRKGFDTRAITVLENLTVNPRRRQSGIQLLSVAARVVLPLSTLVSLKCGPGRPSPNRLADLWREGQLSSVNLQPEASIVVMEFE